MKWHSVATIECLVCYSLPSATSQIFYFLYMQQSFPVTNYRIKAKLVEILWQTDMYFLRQAVSEMLGYCKGVVSKGPRTVFYI